MATASESVSEWLQRHRLGHLVQTFEEQRIDTLAVLRNIKDEELIEMEIKIGDRGRFRQARAETFGDDTLLAGQASDRYHSYTDASDEYRSLGSLSEQSRYLSYTDASDEYRSLGSLSEQSRHETGLRRRVDNLNTTFRGIANTDQRDDFESVDIEAVQRGIIELIGYLEYAPVMFELQTLGQSMRSTLQTLLNDSWNFLRQLLRNGLLWLTEHWKFVAAVICVVLIVLLLIHFQPTVMGLLKSFIDNMSWITRPMAAHLTDRVWGLSGTVATAAAIGSYATNSGARM